MTDLLGLGASGLRAYGRALSNVGDNIANAQTPGYARRTTRLEELAGAGEMVLYHAAGQANGVRVTGINRLTDQWLVEGSRAAGADAGKTTARLPWLEAAETSLAQGGNDVGAALTGLFNSADLLSADPLNTTLRTQFLSSADSIATALRRTAGSLDAAVAGVGAAAAGAVTQLNTDLVALKKVNDGLLRARDGSTDQAGLLDERDRLLDNIGAAVPISVTYDNRQAATVHLGASSGPLMVSGAGGAASFGLTLAIDGRLSYSLSTVGGSIVPSVGQLAGFDEAADHVANQRSALDTLAVQVATDLNTAHVAGFDANGNIGAGLYALGSAGAATIALFALTPANVAAADAGSANGNLLAFSNLRGSSGIEAGWAALVAAQSQSVSTARAEDAAASSRRDGAFAARSDVSGIDLDQEAADLLRFQQAYEGSARVIQVARDTLQSILNIF
jgi:flagellar hook-associated protein 1 FlgK